MKVVLFCGGQGMRIREYSDQIPKPMVPIGYRPILWHVMKYYAAHGHKDFILCLGFKADVIKDYFLNYDECLSNDFVIHGDSRSPELLSSDISDWTITLVDTGMNANIGQRLMKVREHLEGEEVFLANYSDGLSDLPLQSLISNFEQEEAVASFVSVRPNQTFHVVKTGEKNYVTGIEDIRLSDVRINGGYFALRQEIFDYMEEGDELVLEPFQRLIERQKLVAYPYDGFWTSMDTFKDKQTLDEMYAKGDAPWEIWKDSEGA
jgi:glucose-1-phosphate cytidylyltransferase